MAAHWLKFLREQYPKGTRIRLREMKNPRHPVHPGAMGTLDHIDNTGKFHGKWDDGRAFVLIIGEDSFYAFPPAPMPLKFYFPLTATFHENSSLGGVSKKTTVLDGRDLIPYEQRINAELRWLWDGTDNASNLMYWYEDDDSVSDKVSTISLAAERRAGQLWGVAKCQVEGSLTPHELVKLTNYLRDQLSDFAGEGFEHEDFDAQGGTFHVHLWSENDWSIMTEEMRFQPDQQSAPKTSHSSILMTLEREGRSIPLPLPASPQALDSALKAVEASDWSDPFLRSECADCAAPALIPILGGRDNIAHLNRLAEMLQKMDEKTLTKYKAVLDAVEDWSLLGATQIVAHLDDYILMDNYHSPEDMALDFLHCDGNDEIIPFLDLVEYGKHLMEQNNGVIGEYGMVMRGDCKPLQPVQQQTAQEELTME